jgi:hypothetical protein
MNIGLCKYTLTVTLQSNETHLDKCFHWEDNILKLEIAGNQDYNFVWVSKLYPEINIYKLR